MQMFRSALIFSLTVRGIPFFYYGSEQAFAGGRDPRNRESLWQDMGNRDSEIYSLARLLNRARKTHEIWNHPHIEHSVTDEFYSFSRGQFLVLLTNQKGKIEMRLENLPFQEGQMVRNLFNKEDVLQVKA